MSLITRKKYSSLFSIQEKSFYLTSDYNTWINNKRLQIKANETKQNHTKKSFILINSQTFHIALVEQTLSTVTKAENQVRTPWPNDLYGHPIVAMSQWNSRERRNLQGEKKRGFWTLRIARIRMKMPWEKGWTLEVRSSHEATELINTNPVWRHPIHYADVTAYYRRNLGHINNS